MNFQNTFETVFDVKILSEMIFDKKNPRSFEWGEFFSGWGLINQ